MRVQTMVLALMLVPVTAGAAELVSPGDLKATYFDGKPITSTGGRGRPSQWTFTPDGKVTRKAPNGREVAGTWRASDDGFCMTLGAGKREGCYIAVRDNGGVKVMRTGAGAFTWTR